MSRSSLIRLGVAAAVVALTGWLATTLVVSFAARPTATEDLTAAWIKAGPTRLGSPARVTVPDSSTLVAFLVGTDLYGVAGTTTGTCTAEPPIVRLGRPVHINRSLTGVLREGQQTVAIAHQNRRGGGGSLVPVMGLADTRRGGCRPHRRRSQAVTIVRKTCEEADKGSSVSGNQNRTVERKSESQA